MQEQPLTNKTFVEFLEEFKKTNKLDTASSLLRTKYTREMAGEDNDKREEQLDNVNKNLEELKKTIEALSKNFTVSNDKVVKKLTDLEKASTQFKPLSDIKDTRPVTLREDLKSGVAGVKRLGSSLADMGSSAFRNIKSFAKDPLQYSRVGAEKLGRGIEKGFGGIGAGIKDIVGTSKDFTVEGGRFAEAYTKSPRGGLMQGKKTGFDVGLTKFNEMQAKEEEIKKLEEDIKISTRQGFEAPKGKQEQLSKLKEEFVELDPRKTSSVGSKQSSTTNPTAVGMLPSKDSSAAFAPKESFSEKLVKVSEKSLAELRKISKGITGAAATAAAASAPGQAAAGGSGGGGGSMIGDAVSGAASAGIGGKIMGGLGAAAKTVGGGLLTAGKVVGGALLSKPALIAGGAALAGYGAYKGYKALTGGSKDKTAPSVPQEDTEKSRAAAREQYQAGTKEEKEAKERLESFRKENPYDYREKPTPSQEFLEIPGTGKFNDAKKQEEYDKLQKVQASASRKVGEAKEDYKKLDQTQDKITVKGSSGRVREIDNIGGDFKKLDILVERFGYSKSDFLNEDGKTYSMRKINSAYEKEMQKDLESAPEEKDIEPKSTERESVDNKPSFGDKLKSFFGFGGSDEAPIEGRQAGGPVTEGKPYLVGEKGPEIVVPSENSTVVPNDKKAAKAVPQIVETIDMGNGAKKEIMDDGSYTISDAEGITKYDAKGTAVSKITSGFGIRKEENLITGDVKTSYSQGPLSASQTKNKAGEVIEESGSYDFGLAKVSSKTASGKTTTSAEVRGGSDENAAMRDQLSAAGATVQPIVANNVQTNNQTTYMPMKADPRPSLRGSALDRYNDRVAAY